MNKMYMTFQLVGALVVGALLVGILFAIGDMAVRGLRARRRRPPRHLQLVDDYVRERKGAR